MPIIAARTIDRIREEIEALKREGKRIAFVPTMGALHEGHTSLIQKAHQFADEVVVSIFVNPTQFGPNEDYSKYPRTIEEDLQRCEEQGVKLAFCPDTDQLYKKESLIQLNLKTLGDHLCGRTRPGHFNGVIQIVNKLFNIVKPQVAVFGQKDIQQFRILEQMVQEFNHDIQIVMAETMRAADGLALSSRNRYLTTEERVLAPLLYQTLLWCRTEIVERNPVSETLKTAINDLEKAGLQVDYLEFVRYDDLQPATKLKHKEDYILAGAVFLSKARLIDNVMFRG